MTIKTKPLTKDHPLYKPLMAQYKKKDKAVRSRINKLFKGIPPYKP